MSIEPNPKMQGFPRRLLLATNISCALLPAAQARAQERNEDLLWLAPAGCPGRGELAQMVERLLGQPLTRFPTFAQLNPDARVQGNPEAGYQLRLSFRHLPSTETRHLHDTDCHKLAEGAAFIIAMAVDPDAVSAQLEKATAGVQPATPAPAAAPVSKPPPPVRPRPCVAGSPNCPSEARAAEGRDHFAFGASGHALAGSLPALAPSIGAWFSILFPGAALALHGQWAMPQARSAGGRPGAQVEVGLASVGLRACATPKGWRIPIAGCVGPTLTRLTGRGLGVDSPQTRATLVASFALGLRGELAVTRLLFFAGAAETALAVHRPPFGISIEGQETEVFRPKLFFFEAWLGGGARF